MGACRLAAVLQQAVRKLQKPSVFTQKYEQQTGFYTKKGAAGSSHSALAAMLKL